MPARPSSCTSRRTPSAASSASSRRPWAWSCCAAAGRGLELTDAGRRILGYAEDIFAMGDELLEALRDDTVKRILPFRVGIADSVSKSVAYQLVEPALRLDAPVRLVVQGGQADEPARPSWPYTGST